MPKGSSGRRPPSHSAVDATLVTPHDTNVLADGPTRGVYVGGAGDLSVIMVEGTTVLFSGVQAGTVLPISVHTIKSTSTTATAIVALF